MHYYLTPKKRGLGWLPDLPDRRDVIFRPATEALRLVQLAKPARVDLRELCPPIYDQGQLGSCTANALAGAFDFDRRRQGQPFMTPSRLFIYWNERYMEGTVESDAGARLRDGIKSLYVLGVPPETDWSYTIDKFRDKPSEKAYGDAEKSQALQYQRIVTPHDNPTHDMLACLNEGYPFVTGISVYESFEGDEADRTGEVPLPAPDERLLGGHAVLIVGYDLGRKRFIGRNSWGTKWGDKGYFTLPFEYLTNRGLASDMWVIRTVEVQGTASG
jgi:C1A family cysteine protease